MCTKNRKGKRKRNLKMVKTDKCCQKQRLAKIYSMRNNCIAVLLKLAHGPWQWELWNWKNDGYRFTRIGYAPTLTEALQEARKAARAKGK